jgi:hypothetical protein
VEHSKYCRLYLHRGKLALAAMYLRRVRVIGRTFEAALTHVSAVVTPPAPAAKNLGVRFRRPCRGQALSRGGELGRCAAEQRKYYRLHLYSGKLTLATMYLRRVRVNGRSFAAGAPLLTNDSPVVTPPCLQHTTSAWAFGVPAEGRPIVECLGLWCTFPLRGPLRRQPIQRPHIRVKSILNLT